MMNCETNKDTTFLLPNKREREREREKEKFRGGKVSKKVL